MKEREGGRERRREGGREGGTERGLGEEGREGGEMTMYVGLVYEWVSVSE